MPPKDFPQCFYSSAAEFLARSGLLPIKHIYISTNAISILLSRTASISSSSANYTAYTTKPQFGQVLRGRLLNKVENLTKLHQLVLCLRLEFRTKGAFGQKPARRKLNQNLNCNPEKVWELLLQRALSFLFPFLMWADRQMDSHILSFYIANHCITTYG